MTQTGRSGRRLRRAIALAPLLLVIGAAGAMAAPILITFDDDPAFRNVPNGFSSSDASGVHFSDTNGGDLIIVNDPVATWGSNALGVFTDTDDSALRIEFDFVASAISMNVGNDAADYSQAGDEAVLVAYLGVFEVGRTSLVLNRNGRMDQMIGFDGATFDSVVLKYEVDARLGLTEVVDNISVAAIPEPAAAVVFSAGALLFGATLRRQRTKELQHRAGHG